MVVEAEKGISLAYQGRATGAFIRQNCPELIVDLAQQVRSGKRPASDLDAIVGPSTAKALLNSGRPTIAKGGLRGTKRLAAGRRPDHSPFAGLFKAGIATLLLPEHAPNSISFPSIYEGAKADATFMVVTTTDGPVTATLPADLNFKLVEMKLTDGVIARNREGVEIPRVVARKTSAPWTLDATAGQTLYFRVRFEPDFNLFKNGAGPKKSTLQVSGRHWNTTQPQQKPWKLSVPLQGRFLGVSIGAIVWPLASEISFLKPEAYTPGSNYPFEAEVGVIAVKEGMSGTVKPLSLPKGVTMSPVNFQAAKGATTQVKVPLKLKAGQDGIWAQHEMPHPIKLQVDLGGKSYFVDFYVMVYEGFHHWYYNGDVGSCSVSTNLFLGSSGRFNFSAQGYNEDLLAYRTISFRGSLGGIDFINAAKVADANDAFFLNYGWESSALKQRYTELIHQPFALSISVKRPKTLE